MATTSEACEQCGGEVPSGRKCHSHAECYATLKAQLAAARAAQAAAVANLGYAQLAARCLEAHSGRAHEFDRGYIVEVAMKVDAAIAALASTPAASPSAPVPEAARWQEAVVAATAKLIDQVEWAERAGADPNTRVNLHKRVARTLLDALPADLLAEARRGQK